MRETCPSSPVLPWFLQLVNRYNILWRVVRVVVGALGLQKLSRGFLRLVAWPRRFPASWFVIHWTASVEPALSSGTPRLSLLQDPSTAVIQIHRRGSDLSLSRSPRWGSTLRSVRLFVMSIVSLSSSLYRPSLNKNPTFLWQRVPSGLPEPYPQSEQQGFSSALTRLSAMTSDDNHSLHAHTLISQPSVHVTFQQAFCCLLLAERHI